MHYAEIGLAGGTAAYKKKFMKMVPNCHAYYMPDHGGMCGAPYREIDADHWIYIKVVSSEVFSRILNVLFDRYKFRPLIYWHPATDRIFMRDKTYADLNYELRDYDRPEIHPGDDEIEE